MEYSSLDNFIRPWYWPKQEKNPPREAFNEAREASSGGFKAGSSEILAIYPVLREFALTCIPDGMLVHEKASLLALCLVLDGWAVYYAGLMTEDDVNTWMEQMLTHLTLYKIAYAVLSGFGMLPKHHHSFHMRDNDDKFGGSIATGTLERKHKPFKDKAAAVTNVRDFERSIISRLLNHQARLIANPNQFLEGTWLDTAKPTEFGYHHARSASHQQMKLSRGDVIMAQFGASVAAAKIKDLRSQNTSFHAVLEKYNRHSGTLWTSTETEVCMPFDLVLGPCIWSPIGDRQFRVLPCPRAAWHLYA